MREGADAREGRIEKRIWAFVAILISTFALPTVFAIFWQDYQREVEVKKKVRFLGVKGEVITLPGKIFSKPREIRLLMQNKLSGVEGLLAKRIQKLAADDRTGYLSLFAERDHAKAGSAWSHPSHQEYRAFIKNSAARLYFTGAVELAGAKVALTCLVGSSVRPDVVFYGVDESGKFVLRPISPQDRTLLFLARALARGGIQNDDRTTSVPPCTPTP